MSQQQHYQGFNTKLMTPLGRMSRAKKIQITLPDLWDVQNGVQTLKTGDVTGSLDMRASALLGLAGMALLKGSWQRIAPLDFLTAYITEDNGGLPLTIVMENVLIHPPKDMTFDMMAGSDDIFSFELKVMGNVLINGVKVFDRKDEAGLL